MAGGVEDRQPGMTERYDVAFLECFLGSAPYAFVPEEIGICVFLAVLRIVQFLFVDEGGNV